MINEPLIDSHPIRYSSKNLSEQKLQRTMALSFCCLDASILGNYGLGFFVQNRTES